MSDCFVAKLDSSGTSLAYSSYLGGGGFEVCKGISVDSSGAAFVTGTTTSSTAFPVVNALKTSLSGASDAFVSKLSPAGDRFVFSTYLGGEGADDGNALRLDTAGLVYIGGDTASAGFPVTSGVAQGQFRGAYDGFVCVLTNDGSRIVWATYLGGSASESITDLFVGQDGRIVVAGYTASADFPTVQPLQGIFGGSFDAFVAVLGPSGTSLDFSGFLGGGGDDRAYGVAQLANGQLVVAGQVLAGTVSSCSKSIFLSSWGAVRRLHRSNKLFSAAAIRPRHSLPRRRYAQFQRSLRRADSGRRRQPGFCDSVERVRNPSHRPGVFVECECHPGYRAVVFDDLAGWAEPAGSLAIKFGGWPGEGQCGHCTRRRSRGRKCFRHGHEPCSL